MEVDTDEQLAAWRAACLRWFLHGTDASAQAAMSYFDLHCNSAVATGPSTAAAEVTLGPVVDLLRSVGLLQPNGLPVRLEPERHGAYIAARNAARADAHRELLAARRARLEKLLEQRKAAAATMAVTEGTSTTPLLSTRQGAEAARSAVSSFVDAYGGALGVHPFLKGFRALLERQLGEEVVWRWVLKEEALTETGGHRFIEDAVAVLFRLCRQTPPDVLGDCEAGVGGEGFRLGMEVDPQLSDPHLGRLLRILPRDSRLEGRATGELVRTGARRTNIRGELDETSLLLDSPCLRVLWHDHCQLL